MTETVAANTGGWDVVSAITFSALNAHLATDSNFSDIGFEKEIATLINGRFATAGTFAFWRFGNGANGDTISLEGVVEAGSITVGAEDDAVTIDLTGVIIRFDLPLDLYTRADGRTKYLGVDRDTVGITVAEIDLPCDQHADALRSLMIEWAKDHLPDFAKPLAVVDISGDFAGSSGAMAWITPTAAHFSVATAIEDPSLPPDQRRKKFEDESVLAVLTMTENRVPPTTFAATPAFVPNGSHVGVLIDAGRMVEKMLLPHIVTLFPGSTEADFDITSDGYGLTNTRQIKAHDFQNSDGETFKPLVEPQGFKLLVDGDVIQLDFDYFHFYHGIVGTDVIITRKGASRLSLGADGSPEFELEALSGSVTTSNPDWILIAGITLDVIAIVAIVAGVGLEAAAIRESETAGQMAISMSDIGAANVGSGGSDAAGAAASMTAGRAGTSFVAQASNFMNAHKLAIVVAIAATGIAGGTLTVLNYATLLTEKGKVKPELFDDLLKEVSTPVEWPSAGTLRLRSLAFNDGLHLGGELA
ncbi:hypothetical protein DKT77_12325 [Meridianimarinicoccus roseus]|uniref:Protein OrfX2/OrfX3/P47 domain-containing protein n=1 Tax=Meridianimarinicoccus roseus TaxID=2072018 RepID=A0A2V2LA48_9RHOB|nr:TULIP family P47-like protein [Meridianimarinicoccus roseus]PWR02330.1 hypothetical protein DKT77_12325 [Meridianimarinicoccus roseus]